MKLLAAIATALMLVACAGPTVLRSDGNTVAVQHGDSMPGLTSAMEIAAQESGRHGKKPVMDVHRCPGQCITQFRCESS